MYIHICVCMYIYIYLSHCMGVSFFGIVSRFGAALKGFAVNIRQVDPHEPFTFSKKTGALFGSTAMKTIVYRLCCNLFWASPHMGVS